MIKKHRVIYESCDSKSNNQSQRIWQKIRFGKIEIPLDSELWTYTEKEIDSEHYQSLTLWTMSKVFEKDNTRYVMIDENDLLEITPDDLFYNYVDKGRKILMDKHDNWFVFADLNVPDEIIETFSEYRDKSQIDLEKLDTQVYDNVKIFYNEDIEKVKERLKVIRKEAKEEKKKKLDQTAEIEEINEYLKNYQNLNVIEDKNIRIENNILIDKDSKMKLVFTRKIIELFSEKDLFREKNYRSDNEFIELDFSNIFKSLDSKFNFYELKSYGRSEDDSIKWYKINSKRFTFKIYKLEFENTETNAEEEEKIDFAKGKEKFIMNFCFKIKKGKKHHKYFINNIRIPKQKVCRALTKLGYRYGREDLDILARTYNIYLTNIKKYSEVQLELLEKGIGGKIEFDNAHIPVRVEISNPENNIWQLEFDKYVWKTSYNLLKSMNRRYSTFSNVVEFINSLAQATGSNKIEKLEDDIIIFLQKKRKEIEVFEKRAKKLWEDTKNKYPQKILNRDNKIIVKGKLKTYQLEVYNDEVKVYTYPDHSYICIQEKSREGSNLFIHDKLVQFALALMNDSNLGRERIHTLH